MKSENKTEPTFADLEKFANAEPSVAEMSAYMKGLVGKVDSSYQKFLSVKEIEHKKQQELDCVDQIEEDYIDEMPPPEVYRGDLRSLKKNDYKPRHLLHEDDCESVAPSYGSDTVHPYTEKVRTRAASNLEPGTHLEITEKDDTFFKELSTMDASSVPSSSSHFEWDIASAKKKAVKSSRRMPIIMDPIDKLESESFQVMDELADQDATLEGDKELFDITRNALKIIRTPDRTMVYAYIFDKLGNDNKFAGIRCNGGIALGGYAYDRASDACLVDCVQNVYLGLLPFGYKLQMPKCGTWSVDCPIPEKVLEKTFTPQQRKKVAEMRASFPDDRYDICYLQMILAN